jgi:hypothetical protein
MAAQDRLAPFVRVQPPPELDRCVRQRLLAAAETARTRAPRTTCRTAHPGGAPVALPVAEWCVYVLGLVGYGAQALGATARLVWRAVLG